MPERGEQIGQARNRARHANGFLIAYNEPSRVLEIHLSERRWVFASGYYNVIIMMQLNSVLIKTVSRQKSLSQATSAQLVERGIGDGSANRASSHRPGRG